MGHLDDLAWLQGDATTDASGPPGAARAQPRTDLARRQPGVVGANCRDPGRFTAASPELGRNQIQPAGQ